MEKDVPPAVRLLVRPLDIFERSLGFGELSREAVFVVRVIVDRVQNVDQGHQGSRRQHQLSFAKEQVHRHYHTSNLDGSQIVVEPVLIILPN